jgi:UDP-N-acetylmuramyl-tripeptide synthetase
VGDDLKSQVAHMTTVSAGLLNKRIATMRDAGAEYLVLEVTSHALAQYRIFGIPIDVAVMTNVTHEHLDYHKTFANYLGAKLKLFKSAQKTHGGQKVGIVNADDPTAAIFADAVANPLTYGVEQGDLQARQVKLSPAGIDYYVKVDSQKLHIRSSIPGEFNVYNSLAAVGVGLTYGLTPEQIEQGIAALTSVEGRMTRIDEGQDFSVFVDFAHTPDAFEKIFNSLSIDKSKIISLFGAAGQRDHSTRAERGKIAGAGSRAVVITEDDPRDDDLDENFAMIEDGVKQSGNENYFKIYDRTDAIKKALSLAKPGDVVLLLGMGHEKSIVRADGDHPWDEIETAHKILKKLVKSK